MTVGYDGKPLIEKIEIQIRQGEILTLIGPNGAGKSTILKSIAGQLSLLGGAIYLGNENLEQMEAAKLARKMAVVMTGKPYTEWMTCEELVSLGRYPYTGRFGILSDKDKSIVAESMELVQVADLKQRDVNQISDGQRQRVLLARAICQEPQILLLDEPTSFLDIRHKLEFCAVLQELCRKKKLTVIMSLHELSLAERISDRLLCIKNRHIDSFGPPEEVLQSGYISELFSITRGIYDEVGMNPELPAPKGNPKVFVIAGGGSGRQVYRRLQRKQIPFVTGILYENDFDFPVACALSACVISAKAFDPIPETAVTAAKNKMRQCDEVIVCKELSGRFELENLSLLEYAKQSGKKIRYEWKESKHEIKK